MLCQCGERARAHTPSSSADKKANNNASRLSLCRAAPIFLITSLALLHRLHANHAPFPRLGDSSECFALSGKRRSLDLGEKFCVDVLRRAGGWRSVISTANKFVLERISWPKLHCRHARESSLLLTSSATLLTHTRISSFIDTSWIFCILTECRILVQKVLNPNDRFVCGASAEDSKKTPQELLWQRWEAWLGSQNRRLAINVGVKKVWKSTILLSTSFTVQADFVTDLFRNKLGTTYVRQFTPKSIIIITNSFVYDVVKYLISNYNIGHLK